jgi:hypothetical protein
MMTIDGLFRAGDTIGGTVHKSRLQRARPLAAPRLDVAPHCR